MIIFKIQLGAFVVIVITWIIMALTDPDNESDFIKWIVLGLWGSGMLVFIGSILYGVAYL